MMEAVVQYLTDFGRLEADRFVSGWPLAKDIRALEVGATVPLLTSRVLMVTGNDRLDFVQGQLSNDVKGLPVGGVTHALMLNHKGHALADVRVVRRGEDLLLIVEGGKGELVRQSLEAHIIFDAVKVQVADYLHVTVQGSQVLDKLKGEDIDLADGAFQGASSGALWFKCQRTSELGADVLVPIASVPTFLAWLGQRGLPLAGEGALTAARIAAGIPAAETEAGDGVLPQESGLESAVSYRKGCYLGQEIMARIEARGKLRRSLAQLQFEELSNSLEVGEPVIQADKGVGRLGAVATHPELGTIALAVIRNDLDTDIVTVSGHQARLHYLLAG
jgi:folate-binding protein YgfZ